MRYQITLERVDGALGGGSVAFIRRFTVARGIASRAEASIQAREVAGYLRGVLTYEGEGSFGHIFRDADGIQQLLQVSCDA